MYNSLLTLLLLFSYVDQIHSSETKCSFIDPDVINEVRRTMRSLAMYGLLNDCVDSKEAYKVFDETAMNTLIGFYGISDKTLVILTDRRLIDEDGKFYQSKLYAWKFLKEFDPTLGENNGKSD